MSNPDSFIDEVTEEVRRDRLFAIFRKYGWIGALLVLAIVGGAAFNEWQKHQATARAQAFGDAMMDALDLGGPEDRRDAISGIPADGAQVALKELMLASDPAQDKAGTLKALDAVLADSSLPKVYRDIAALRRVMVAGADMALADRRALLEGIATPGQPMRVLAQEQLAYLLLEDGKKDEAIAALSALVVDQESPAGLKARARQAITALGGTPPEAAKAG